MTIAFALDYIPRRMRELGYGDNYITRWRHLQLDANANTEIESSNEYYLLITPSNSLAVKSKLGVFDKEDTALNEMQYEHRGKIQIKNKSHEVQFVLFIQVIPNHS